MLPRIPKDFWEGFAMFLFRWLGKLMFHRLFGRKVKEVIPVLPPAPAAPKPPAPVPPLIAAMVRGYAKHADCIEVLPPGHFEGNVARDVCRHSERTARTLATSFLTVNAFLNNQTYTPHVIGL
jgi:hypothetical protein